MSEVPLYQHASPTAMFGGEPRASSERERESERDRERERERGREHCIATDSAAINSVPRKLPPFRSMFALHPGGLIQGCMCLANKKMPPPKTLR